MNKAPIYLNYMGMVNALGSDSSAILNKLLSSDNSAMAEYTSDKLGHKFYCWQSH